MKSEVINNKAEFKRWLDGVQENHYASLVSDEPTSYPCIVFYDVRETSARSGIADLECEYAYLSDFMCP